MSFVKEFKEFISKGNVVDLAVGIIIGGAFGKIVSSLVSDILMPPLGILISGVSFTDIKITLNANDLIDAVKILPPVTLNIGNFIQTLIDFLIIAFSLFLVIKGMNRLKKKEAEVPKKPAEHDKSELLLTEIRDMLKK